MYDLLITNGDIVDGTGASRRTGNVAVQGGTIAAVGETNGTAQRVLDAGGRVVAPGFIDPHTHMDVYLLQHANGLPVINYGVTTVIIGDCGASCAPVPSDPEAVDILVAYLRRVLDQYIESSIWSWSSLPEYLATLEGRVGVNVGMFVPHSPVRLSVMGADGLQRAATPDELERMTELVRGGIEAGAVGFSSSPKGGPALHRDTPSTLANEAEFAALTKPAHDVGGVLQLNGFNMVNDPESRYCRIAKASGMPVIGNEFLQPAEDDERGRLGVETLANAAAEGRRWYGVVIPYHHVARYSIEEFHLLKGLPAWEALPKKPGAELAAALTDREVRRRLQAELDVSPPRPVFGAWRGWRYVFLDTVHTQKYKHLEKRSLDVAGTHLGRRPIDALFDVMLADDLRTGIYNRNCRNGSEEILAEMIRCPQALIGTDTGAHLDRFFWYGAAAHLLGYWRRSKGLFSLEAAVHKITQFNARKLGMRRGVLRQGLPADITIFDPDAIGDCLNGSVPDYVDQQQLTSVAPGLHTVIVNGHVAMDDGEVQPCTAGKVRRWEL